MRGNVIFILSICLYHSASGLLCIHYLLMLVLLGFDCCQPRVVVVLQSTHSNVYDDYPDRSPAYTKALNENFKACCQAIPNFPTSC